MAGSGELPGNDQITLTDTDARVYEAIATLEFMGRRVCADDIAVTTGLDDAVLLTALAALTERGVLVRTGPGADAEYAPAYRGWSAAPDQAVNRQR
jgi:hypothetical protein